MFSVTRIFCSCIYCWKLLCVMDAQLMYSCIVYVSVVIQLIFNLLLFIGGRLLHPSQVSKMIHDLLKKGGTWLVLKRILINDHPLSCLSYKCATCKGNGLAMNIMSYNLASLCTWKCHNRVTYPCMNSSNFLLLFV